MVNAICPVCGKGYAIPLGRGREMVVTKFLAHKDDDEFVMVGGRVGVVVDIQPNVTEFPLYEVQMPSGRSNIFHAAEISRVGDQDQGRQRFYK